MDGHSYEVGLSKNPSLHRDLSLLQGVPHGGDALNGSSANLHNDIPTL